MLVCEECGNWLHSKCVGLSCSVAATLPFVCRFCLQDLHRQVASLLSGLTQVSDSVCSLVKSVALLSQQSVLVKDELATIRQSLGDISSKLNSLTTSSLASSASTLPSVLRLLPILFYHPVALPGGHLLSLPFAPQTTLLPRQPSLPLIHAEGQASFQLPRFHPLSQPSTLQFAAVHLPSFLLPVSFPLSQPDPAFFLLHSLPIFSLNHIPFLTRSPTQSLVAINQLSHLSWQFLSSSLTIISFNACSVVANFHSLVSAAVLHSPDIVCISETWLSPEVLSLELNIPDYCLFRLDRSRHGGSVAIYAKSYLQPSVFQLPSHSLELITVTVRVRTQCFHVSSFY